VKFAGKIGMTISARMTHEAATVATTRSGQELTHVK
jgi:hypothetical protein